MTFEPVPRIYRRLVANVRCNHAESRTQALLMAVSRAPGRCSLHVPKSPLPSSASLALDGFRNIAGELIDVEVTTIDHILHRLPPAFDQGQTEAHGDPTPVVVKIDVEGFEHDVLAGMSETLTQWRPVVICECNPDGPYREVEQIAKAYEHRLFHLRDPAPVPVTTIIPDPTERYRNFALVPAGDAAAVAVFESKQ